MTAIASAAIATEVTLLVGGLVLAWRHTFGAAAQAPTQLAEWSLPLVDFVRFLLLAVCATLAGNIIGSVALKFWPVGTDARAMVLTACSQIGMLAGITFFRASAERLTRADLSVRFRDFIAGGAIFLIALPFVTATNVSWLWLLKTAGYDLPKQELVDMFLNARSPLFLGFMIMLAVVTAPLAEELLFRGGIFRYLRTRAPRWAALVGPACLFAALHQHVASFVPLIVLGVIFSLGYERTGRLAPLVVAHACFNLHTIALLLCGIGA